MALLPVHTAEGLADKPFSILHLPSSLAADNPHFSPFTSHMSIGFTGGCACGAIRYECTAEPMAMFHCHCRDCQRATGGPCTSIVMVPEAAFKLLQGSPRWHSTSSTAGGKLDRGFCSECGSPLLGRGELDGGNRFVGVHAASLDDPGLFKPQMHIWTGDAQPWDHMNPALPKFEQYPPSG